MNQFNLEKYEKQNEKNSGDSREYLPEFYDLCASVQENFFADWQRTENSRAVLEIQKRAIIGYEKEKNFFIERIKQITDDMDCDSIAYPGWYENLYDAVYQENWGLAGLAEWFSENYSQSSSAKIIGERIYFMDGGHMKLMPQTISEERKNQLIKAFLLLTPHERMDKDYYEVYLLDGTRVTVFTQPLAKSNQASLIFRRYLIPNLSFEEQAKRHTIPEAAIPLFKMMVGLGFNVVFMGAVRTAKTTFLTTWQSYERDDLEGVMVETDPEIPMHKILPTAPIIQLIADGDELLKISKSLLRSDADYFILAEARDGVALDTAVKIAAKGTKRMKLTFHSRLPEHFPLEAATEIVKSTGGDLKLTMQMVASGFDYLFHFVQLSDKSQKRLKGIYQMNCDSKGVISVDNICEYCTETESWHFKNIVGPGQREYAKETDVSLYSDFCKELCRLSELGEVV